MSMNLVFTRVSGIFGSLTSVTAYLDICQELLCNPVVATGKDGVIKHTQALLDVELTWRLAG